MLYLDPAHVGISYDVLHTNSANGKKLILVRFNTAEKPKGTVVFFHGNFGNVSNHFAQAYFLVENGFDVIALDYQGYGGSEGTPTPAGVVEDGLAAVRYAQEHSRVPQGKVAVFGQSLGGAVAVLASAREPLVAGVVVESAFTRYRSMARHVTSKSLLLWPLYPLYPLLLPRRYDPIDQVAALSPRPVLFIHGDNDQIIPVNMSEKLFKAAQEPKELWIVKGANHLGCRSAGGGEYEKKIVAFFNQAFGVRQDSISSGTSQ